MKSIRLVSVFSLLSLCLVGESFGQVTPSKMESTTKPSSQIQTVKPLEPAKPSTSKPSTASKELPAPLKPTPQVPQHATYLHPGILVNVEGKWEGSDHLLNLTNNIGVYVTIIKPENENLEITEADLQKEIEAIFAQANIKPLTLAATGSAPLPAFEVEIFVYPIDRGYTACCDGRLFESVTLDRFKMDPNMAFQAVTWEKQTLLVTPKSQFAEQLRKNVQEIARAFTERFQIYERLKRTSTY